MEYRNRRDAGRQLAARLARENLESPLVLALPRGGVEVGYEVARALHAPLEVLVVRKIGSPMNREYGIGAVTEEGYHWINQDAADAVDATPGELDELLRAETEEVRRRVRLYRAGRPLPSVRGRTVVLVDDGLATGVTARVACRYLRQQGAGRLILAVPVCSPSTAEVLSGEVDQLISLEKPEIFYSVGQFYEDFSQTTDQEVVHLLDESRAAEKAPRKSRVALHTAARRAHREISRPVDVTGGEIELPGHLMIPSSPQGVVIFAHGSGSSRLSPRNQQVAHALNSAGLGTLLFDLLTPDESGDRSNVFDIPLLATRLLLATSWLKEQPVAHGLPIGYFGASTGAGAALWAAADLGAKVSAVVSRGGRPDLALPRLDRVTAPTLLIVGGFDEAVIELNQRALRRLRDAELVIVPGATHLFEEPGALEAVGRHAISWFSRHFARAQRRAA